MSITILFVDVMLGVGVVFEIPVLLFLLTLIHVASPAFLVRHSRYAILAIVTLAAIITPQAMYLTSPCSPPP
jgi:sec-independent protein translocase protein TatC